MARLATCLNHLRILRCNELLLLLLDHIAPICLVNLSLDILDRFDLVKVLSSPALHITNILDDHALDLKQKLKRRLTIDLTAADSVIDVNLLDLITERVQHFGEVDRFGSLGGLAASPAAGRLEMHRLRLILLQRAEDAVVDPELEELLVSRLRLLLVLHHELCPLYLSILQYFLIGLRHLLLLVNLRQVVFLELEEDLLELVRVREEELIFVVVVGHIDQAKLHQLLEPLLPFVVRDRGMNRPPFSVRALLINLVLASWTLLSQEREIHLDIVMNVIIVLEDNVVVEIGVSLVTHDPVSFQSLEILGLICFSLHSKFFA